MRAVFETNVLIAAFLTDGVCSNLLVRARRSECELILSIDILQEFERILHTKFSLSSSEISDAKRVLAEAAREMCRNVNRIEPVCRDPNDDKILACAQQVNADYIVTGDEDLLVMKRYAEVKIVSPRDFESLFP